jgi:putative addiction module component (TIGR02574 family)
MQWFADFEVRSGRKCLMSTFSDVFAAAQTLPLIDRLHLIDALWGSVPADALPPPTEEWIAEAQRRTAAREAGETTTLSWPEVRANARKKAGLDG